MLACPWEQLKNIPELCLPLTCLKGVGPKRARLLAAKGLRSIQDLFYLLPVRYEDRTRLVPIDDAVEGERIWVRGKAIRARENFFPKSRKRVFEIIIEDASGQLGLVWFHYNKAHLFRLGGKGAALLAYGPIQGNGSRKQMIHPELRSGNVEEEKDYLEFYPVYPVVDGISQGTLKSLVSEALEQYADHVPDALPDDIRVRHGLSPLGEAIQGVHRPSSTLPFDSLAGKGTRFHRRLYFDVHLKTMLNLEFRKAARWRRTIPPLLFSEGLVERLKGGLPFALTEGQSRAVEDILSDLTSGHPMSRLLQGDVGCGKTVVAAIAASLVISGGKQAAFMAPTQVLARQHHDFFLDLPKVMGFKPIILTGATKTKERRKAYHGIEKGEANMIIGTQALIQETLDFSDLGLAIVDEQHRFGVAQRSMLDGKGHHPHLLVMSATPIPRTLAMTLYGDMDISTIREYPTNRLPVVTRLVRRDHKRQVYTVLKERMSKGEQALVICPVIDAEGDDDLKNTREMTRKLRILFQPPFHVDMIHGRMSPQKKDGIMEAFRKGEIHLLVGTTVVEVGIHAPGATVMVVEQPERFGLAQLHQLRGRVGRGHVRGLCLLMLSDGLPDAARERLDLLARTGDGFVIAQMDLQMRGQGELMGMKQTGNGEWTRSDMPTDPDALAAAREEAERIAREDPGLCTPANRPLRSLIAEEWKRPLEI